MSKNREIDTRPTVRIVTHNNLITARGFPKMSVKARKLLYLTISQCQKNDDQFYCYELSAKDFSQLIGTESHRIYDDSMKICRELSHTSIEIIEPTKRSFVIMPLMACCQYDKGIITLKLNQAMTSVLLQLKGNFSQPLLADFMHMNSAYSMEVWHLMQREMKSCHPGTRRIEFYLSLDEIRQVTGTTNKLLKISHFRERVWDKALREIYDNLAIKVEYDMRKEGRRIIGFDCRAYCTHKGQIIDLTDYVPDMGK